MSEIKTPVALKRAPTVDVQLPGESGLVTFKLAYDFRAICLVKKMTGKSLLNPKVLGEIEDDPELLVTVLYAGLRLHQPELSFDDVCGMFLPGHIDIVLPKIFEAWIAAQPPKVDDDPKPGLPTEPVAVQK